MHVTYWYLDQWYYFIKYNLDCSVWNRDSVTNCHKQNGSLLLNCSCVLNVALDDPTLNTSQWPILSFNVSNNAMPTEEYF